MEKGETNMRNKFDQELELLNTELIEMGALIETAIDRAVAALFKKDEKLAESAIEFDLEVDRKEHEIETRCLQLLLRQQPVARDLRVISAALKMITDMERIGDQAGDIAEITLRLSEGVDLRRVEHISAMARATVQMVTGAIDAFVARDLKLAGEVVGRDDEVDALFVTVRDDLIAIVRAGAEDVGAAVDLLMIAKYFERIGDHAVNIAEWVIFSITGVHQNADHPGV